MRPSPCGNMAGSKRIVRLMRAEEITGKLLLHLLTADGGKGAIHAVAGIVKDPIQTIIGQGDHFIGGTIHAFRGVEIDQHAGKSHTVHPGDIIRFAAARQDLKALAFKLKRAVQTDSAGTSCY